MTRDPIVEEVRRIRDSIAREHGYDVMAIVRELQRQESESGGHLVSLPPRRIPPESAERQRPLPL